MTPRSQLQPGQGITPEPKLSAEKEYRKCNDYFHFHVWDLSIKLGGVIVYYLKMMIDLISYLMLFCLLFTRQSFAAFTPGQDIERREERERRGQWAAFIGVKSDYCCSLSFPGWLGASFQAHWVTLSGDPGPDTGPTTYTVQSRRQARSENKV